MTDQQVIDQLRETIAFKRQLRLAILIVAVTIGFVGGSILLWTFL